MLTVRNREGKPEVRRAAPTPTPGLWVVEARDADSNAGWSVTHKRSGLAIAFFDSPEAALAAAMDLDGVMDWTLSGEQVHRPPVIPVLIPAAIVLLAAVGFPAAAHHTDTTLRDRRDRLATSHWLTILHRVRAEAEVLVERDPRTQPVFPHAVSLRHPDRPALRSTW